MPLLDRTGPIADAWIRADEAGDLPFALLPPAAAQAAVAERKPGQSIGLSLPGSGSNAELPGNLAEFALIDVAFSSFSDGRGLSLARRLRRAGYAGRLRASGPLIADLFADLLACGFDEVELPAAYAARQPIDQWLTALSLHAGGYQSGYGGASILDRRRAARADSDA